MLALARGQNMVWRVAVEQISMCSEMRYHVSDERGGTYLLISVNDRYATGRSRGGTLKCPYGSKGNCYFMA